MKRLGWLGTGLLLLAWLAGDALVGILLFDPHLGFVIWTQRSFQEELNYLCGSSTGFGTWFHRGFTDYAVLEPVARIPAKR